MDFTVSAALLLLGYAYLLWALFIAVMALRWAWYRLTLPVKVLAAPLVLVAFTADLVFNLMATVPFIDLPREATFSQRMGRYKATVIGGKIGQGWRAAVARWVCSTLLDPFEIGGHCR